MPNAASTSRPASGLTPRQVKFATEYAKHGIGGQAAKTAGYSARTAYSAATGLLKNPKIKALIEATQAKSTAQAGVTIEGVLSDLDDLHERGLADNNLGAVAKAIELKGKWLKMFSDSHVVNVEIQNHDDQALRQSLAALGVVTLTAGDASVSANEEPKKNACA